MDWRMKSPTSLLGNPTTCAHTNTACQLSAPAPAVHLHGRKASGARTRTHLPLHPFQIPNRGVQYCTWCLQYFQLPCGVPTAAQAASASAKEPWHWHLSHAAGWRTLGSLVCPFLATKLKALPEKAPTSVSPSPNTTWPFHQAQQSSATFMKTVPSQGASERDHSLLWHRMQRMH